MTTIRSAMRTVENLCDPRPIQDDEEIGHADGGEPMRDENRDAAIATVDSRRGSVAFE